MRGSLAALCAGALALALAAAGCGEEERPPPGNQVDAIMGATATIVVQCRSLERGFVSSVDREAVGGAVDTLVEATEQFDPDAPFRRPAPAVEPETTLRDQIELAADRLEDDCSPEDAERLRAALDD